MTTRASTVKSSMPTSDTLTYASMTIPLSRMRSRISAKLLLPGGVLRAGVYVAVISVFLRYCFFCREQVRRRRNSDILESSRHDSMVCTKLKSIRRFPDSLVVVEAGCVWGAAGPLEHAHHDRAPRLSLKGGEKCYVGP